jgi:hypothetical protein
VAARLEAGAGRVNHLPGFEADIPFDDFKDSGLGREQGITGQGRPDGCGAIDWTSTVKNGKCNELRDSCWRWELMEGAN